MSQLMSNIDKTSKIAGENRMQVLLFKLNSSNQSFGINVFKVREVMSCPEIHKAPGSHKFVEGLIHVRGESLPVINLATSIGFQSNTNLDDCLIILTEFNRTVQAFVVDSVERIENINWDSVSAPPQGIGSHCYLTSVAKVNRAITNDSGNEVYEDDLVGILDVEKVLAEINGEVELAPVSGKIDAKVMIMDDSAVARKQLRNILEHAGASVTMFNDGKSGFDHLLNLIEDGKKPSEEYDLIISDIEMPQMDGYHFSSNVKSNAELKNIPLILHTSLSGVFNESLVNSVGADAFVSKFEPKVIISEINRLLDGKK